MTDILINKRALQKTNTCMTNDAVNCAYSVEIMSEFSSLGMLNLYFFIINKIPKKKKAYYFSFK